MMNVSSKLGISLVVLISTGCGGVVTSISKTTPTSTGGGYTPDTPYTITTPETTGSSGSSSGSSQTLASQPNHFIYVTHQGSNTVDAYSTDSTGHISVVAGSSLSTGSQPISAILHPNHKWLYVINYNSYYLNQYQVNASTGALTAMSNPTVGSSLFSKYISFDANGYLYVESVVSGTPQDLSKYSVNSTTGELTFMQTIPTSSASSLGLVLLNRSSVGFEVYNYPINGSTIEKYVTASGVKSSDTFTTTGTQPSSLVGF